MVLGLSRSARLAVAKRRRRRLRRPGGRLDGRRCAGCDKPVEHKPNAWFADGPKAAIRCLDCRKVFCPRCARGHFLPVQRAQSRAMAAVMRLVVRAVRDMNCRTVRRDGTVAWPGPWKTVKR